MNCNEARQNLEPALDGALTEAALRSVQAHVTTCALCGEKLERLEAVRALLREAPLASPSESLDARVMRSFHKHHANRSSGQAALTRLRGLFLGSLHVPVPILAMFLIAVIGIVLLAYRTGKQNAPQIVINREPIDSERVEVDGARDASKKTAVVDQTVSAPSSPPIATTRYRKNRVPAAIKNRVAKQSVESSTIITSTSTTYSTLADLKGFEPLPIATARIIKGEQR